jgi:hypothetical protein
MDTFVLSVGRVVRDIIIQPKREITAEWRREIILVLRWPTSTEAGLDGNFI